MTSFVIVATKARDRWFDLDAVRTELLHPEAVTEFSRKTGMVAGEPRQGLASGSNPAGAPPLDWTNTEPPPTESEREECEVGTARYIIGDVFDGLATLPDDSVDLVFTSPPFLALRSYLPSEHPDKAKELGSEATPADFLDTLLDVVEACDRVLAPHGTLCFELGDTYSGGGGENHLYEGTNPERGFNGSANQGSLPGRKRDRSNGGWPLDKSLCGIPTLFAWSLAYGRNLLRPERTTPPWRIRNLVVWGRPNPPVGALGDKWRPASSYVTVATKARDRWFDLDAVRHEHSVPPETMSGGGYDFREGTPKDGNGSRPMLGNPNGAPPLDWQYADGDLPELLDLPTAPYPGSHYATMTPRLVAPFIDCCCPRQVCQTCGKPSERIVEHERTFDNIHKSAGRSEARTPNAGPMGTTYEVIRETLGWTDCEHDNYRRGVVLDPFAGSGTTLAVATGMGRDAIGIDLDERNAELARERCGMFLEVDAPSSEPPAAVVSEPQRGNGNARFRAGYDRRDGRKTMQREDYGAPLPDRRR